MPPEKDAAPPPAASFPTTCWSRLAAGESRANQALETLAARYWPAVVAWLMRGPARDEEEARDLAQGFFVHVLETDFLAKADPNRGRFRAFLKGALKNWVTSRAREALAQKRGGGRRFVPMQDGDRGLEGEAGDLLSIASEAPGPDEALDAVWRAELIAGALASTRERLIERDQLQRFEVFRAYHVEGTGEDYEALAERFAISRTDVSNHLARAKALFREELRSRVLETVGSDEDLRAELEWLFQGGSGS